MPRELHGWINVHDYIEGRNIFASIDASFYGLLVALVIKADEANQKRLDTAFPGIVSEVYRRFEAPGGRLEGE